MERIEKLKDFLQKNPSDSFVAHALALEYVKRNQNEEAKKTFQRLLERDEKYVGSYYHLAKLTEAMGNVQESISIYEKGMKIAKELGDAHAFNELQAAYEDLIY